MKYLLVFLSLLTCAFINAQENIQDPEAARILESVGEKFRSLPSFQTDFELSILDRKDNSKNTSAGNLVLKQQKYKLNSEGSIVFYDGKTMWTYVQKSNEVTITEPRNNSGDFMSNPYGFFTSYKNEFKYRYVKETLNNGVTCHEIDLFPKNLNQPYSRIKVLINKQTSLPEAITSIGKDGVDYSVRLKNTVTSKVFPDTAFTFNPAEYKKVEIIDMRGL
ncbi:MAG TPA: outer membrane lipoprotein carrier protein LolA [Bacteroidales bacterium]|nr:outer membrane lipoprotein carrier protein LolA [Bacteroidales bacterium]